ncbi:MAG: putative maltokinase, partial [Acetobacteraceae bacterium]|nr:putative maltokinase [Acetobacteraceae bacterium]
SNSSLIVGNAAMVKLFRRLVAGPHPEAEMGRYLTEQGFAHTPALLGEMVRVGADGTRHTLAVAQGFIRNQGDAWTWMLDWMLRALSDLPATEEAEASPDRFAEGEAIASVIGQRLGEMHAVLARPTKAPDFAPERADDAVLDRWARDVAAQIDAALRALAGARASLEPQAQAEAEALERARGLLVDVARGLARHGAGATLTRIHGDLHLGQMLVSSGDVYIIDFEGEPARPLEQRRAKTSPMRDLAGVIRSFDYAVAVVGRKSREAHAHVAEERREAFLAETLNRLNACFLAGYRALAPSSDDAADAALLRLFLIEKAAYEVAYEAANRPSWIDVPLHGLARIADEVLAPERQAAE